MSLDPFTHLDGPISISKMKYIGAIFAGHTVDPERENICSEYILRYFVTMFWNVSLLSLYSVQVFTEHQPCLSPSSHDITETFELAFQLGFALRLLDFVNSEVLIHYIRFRGQM